MLSTAVLGCALVLAGGAATGTPTTTTPTTTAPTPAAAPGPITRWSGTDRYETAATISAASFAPGVAVAYVATGAAFPDALAGAAAAGGKGPVLLVETDQVPAATLAELHRLAPRKVVVLGGPNAVADSVLATVGAAAGGAPVTQVAGADRYGTAAAVSAGAFSKGVATAYLATGADWPDALAGAAAAGGHGPVLLAQSGALPAATAAELTRLAPRRVVVLGSASSVSDATASAAATAAGSVPTSRWAGLDEFGDAAAISSSAFAPGVATAFLATAADFADALAGAAVAAGRGPVLLVTAGTLPNVEAAELRRLHAASTTVFGGTLAVSDAVARAAAAVSAQGIPAPSAQAPVAVATAEAQLGKPYVWGGSGPDSFDCSGLTAFAWKAAGVTLPHNAAMQDDQVASIPPSAAQPGDLLFYGSPVYHVAIYAGNGQMIEAAHSGVPVRVTAVRTQDLADAGRP